MKVLNGYDVDTQERVLTDVPEEAAAFWKEIKASPEWEKFVDEYGNTSQNNDAVLECLNKLYPAEEFTSTGQFLDALNVAIDAGELERKPQEPEPEPIPVDRNGRTLAPHQIAWGEMVRWSNAASSAAIKERVRTDEAYAKFHRANLRKEMDQPVGDDVTLLNPHIMRDGIAPTSTAMKNERLVAFANRYRQMSSEEVRKAKRLDYNPLTARQFIKDEEACIDQNLI